MSLMSPRTEKLVRRLTFVTTVAASYFLLTADYGPKPNALDPVSPLSKQHFLYDFIATQHSFTISFLNSQVGFLFLVTNTFFKLILFVIIICCNFELSSFIGLK